MDARDLGEQNNQFVVSALDFANLGGNKERAFLDDAFSSKDAVSPVNQIAAKRSGIDTFGQMIRKSNQHEFSKCFGIELVDFFLHVQAFLSGDLNKLLENWSDLLGDGIANAQTAGLIRAMLLGVKPCPDQYEEI